MMLDRLVGLETEYAIRFTPLEQGGPVPGNDVIYDVIIGEVERRVATQRGERTLQHRQRFTQNGGSIGYEMLPWAPKDGLIEGGTPECASPEQLLLYQQAQDRLLQQAAKAVGPDLAALGFPGEVALLKNCRDAEGNVYGAQENYETRTAEGWRLTAYRLGLVALAPLLLVTVLGTFAYYLGLIYLFFRFFLQVVIPTMLVLFLIRFVWWRAEDAHQRARNAGLYSRYILRGLATVEIAVWTPVTMLLSALLHAFVFRRQRHALTSFLVTRPVVTGTGTVGMDGTFGLSEKGPAIRRVMRWSVLPSERPIFDTGNLIKYIMESAMLRLGKYRALFGTRQRMQLGLSDSNVAQTAEYLKIAITMLMVDLAEAGQLDDAPVLRSPVRALHTLVADPTLRARLTRLDAEPSTALEIQRWYCERAQAVLDSERTTPIGAHEVVRLWREALDGLATDPTTLVGRLDWVTKRYLLERAGGDAPYAVLKKIDLKYHELGEGYLAQFQRAGGAVVIVDDAAIEAAILAPPEGTPAFARGRIIQRLADSDVPAVVSWDKVRIGGRVVGKVIRLSDYRAGDDGDL